MRTLAPRGIRRVVISLALSMGIGATGGAFLVAANVDIAWFYALGIVLVFPVVLQGLYAGHGLPSLRRRDSSSKSASYALASMALLAGSLEPSSRRNRQVERCLFVGSQSSFVRLHHEMPPRERHSATFVGSVFLTHKSSERSVEAASATLHTLIKNLRVDRLVVELSPDSPQPELDFLMREIKATSVQLSSLPSLVGPAFSPFDAPPRLSGFSQLCKRTLDLLLAAFGYLVLAPLFALIAVAIKLDSRGPVFFRQIRVGRDGMEFEMLKFRTMFADAQVRLDQLLEDDSDPTWLKLDGDPRITRVGRFLRRLNLDELPQLWNVLRGEMSMVGPRPLIETEVERRGDSADWCRSLTPGVTGYWQVLGRTRIPFEEMLKLDYVYVMDWSLWRDIQLLLRRLFLFVSPQPRYEQVSGPTLDREPYEQDDDEPPLVLVSDSALLTTQVR